MKFARLTISIFLLLFVAPAISDNDLSLRTVQTRKYNLSELEIKKSAIRAILVSSWQIVEHSRYKLRADYKGVLLEVVIHPDSVEFRGVKGSPKVQSQWTDKLVASLFKEMEYRFESNIANDLISTNSE